MKSLSSLPPQLLTAYYRSQGSEVKDNLRKALGLFRDYSFGRSQVSDNQVVTITRKKITYSHD